MNEQITALVTGVAPLSLGEAIVDNLHKQQPTATIITVDQRRNPALESRLGDHGAAIELDLNPLHYGSGAEGFSFFAAQLRRELVNALSHFERDEMRSDGITFLFNNAGVYGFGPLVDTTYETIADLAGVNYLGQLLTAQTVMILNKELGGVNFNSQRFRLCKVGSFQGINLRAGRPVYAPSKAIGLDIAQTLALGHETKTVIYLAVGPIDTHMLHYNLWNKAGGEDDFVRGLYARDIDSYRAVFVNGNEQAFRRITEDYPQPQRDEHLAMYSRYVALKEQYAQTAEFATESADDIGRDVVARMIEPDCTSGILVFDKQWDGKNYVRRVAHRAFDPEVPGAYNKFTTIVNGVTWQELPPNGTPQSRH